jgi:hypothetical protein
MNGPHAQAASSSRSPILCLAAFVLSATGPFGQATAYGDRVETVQWLMF